MENEPVFCFQHCQTDVNILYLTLPEICPVCSNNISSTPQKIPPFRVPSPFVHSVDAPFSIVIQPTHGTFLRDYSNDADLHIGISDSRGCVYHFNEKGMNKSEEGWAQCLASPILGRTDINLRAVWDPKLIDFSAYDKWQSANYSECGYNCYTFVLDFLKVLNEYSPLEQHCRLNKAEFSETILLPQTTQAAKYISLYRKVIENQVVVQYNTEL